MATFIGLLSSVLYTNRSYMKKTFTLTIACHPIPRVTSITGTCEAAISVTAVSIHITCMVTSSTFIDIYRRNGIYSSILYILNIPPYYCCRKCTHAGGHNLYSGKTKNIHTCMSYDNILFSFLTLCVSNYILDKENVTIFTTAGHPISRVTRDTGTCEAAISVTAVSIHITCMITSSTFINIYNKMIIIPLLHIP